jgi:hypothetical protein
MVLRPKYSGPQESTQRGMPSERGRSEGSRGCGITFGSTDPAAKRFYEAGDSLTGSVFSWLMNADSANAGVPASSIAG